MSKIKVNIGDRYGRLSIVKELEPRYYGKTPNRRFECICDCGNTATPFLTSLRSGDSKSCGCWHDERAHNSNKSKIYGVGVNDYLDVIFINGRSIKSYLVWRTMLSRCYSKITQKKQPTYVGCSVCEEWKYFSNFKQWYDENYDPETMKNWHLDKDILFKGNKLYSPQTCAFVPPEINVLYSTKRKKRHLPIGVTKARERYIARANTKHGQIHIGVFDTIEEASKAYLDYKTQYIKEVADRWKERIAPHVYEAMCNYKVEITD